MRSRISATAFLATFGFSLVAISPVALRAQGHALRLWWIPQADVIGLSSVNNAARPMTGASLLLLYRRPESAWSLGVGLGGMSQATPSVSSQFSSSVAGLTVEARRSVGRGAIQPYLVGSLFAGTIRVDEFHPIGGDLLLFGGSDATTASLGAGAGAEASVGRFRLFLDMQYNWRSNGIYGRSGMPLRLGLHF